MKNSAEALKGALVRIKTAVSQGKYDVASNASTDFIKLSYSLEFKTGVFTGEVLEAICIQIYHTLYDHLIPDGDYKELNEKMAKYLNDLIEDCGTQRNLYDVLTNMRYEVTVFQFESDFKYKSPKQTRQKVV